MREKVHAMSEFLTYVYAKGYGSMAVFRDVVFFVF